MKYEIWNFKESEICNQWCWNHSVFAVNQQLMFHDHHLVKLLLRTRKNLISHVRFNQYSSSAIFFAFISIFALHSSNHTIVHFFTSWRWAVIRSSELQERISDTIQRVSEFSSRRKSHTRSIVIVRSRFRWRSNKWFFTSIHRTNVF